MFFFFIFSKFWFFKLLVGSKGKKWPKMTKASVCRTLYLRNHTSYDHGDLSRCFFHFFKILIFQVVRGGGAGGGGGGKGKKWPKMTKIFVCLTPYLRNHTSYDCGFWYTCVKWWYLQQVFPFFQNSNFGVF